MKKEPTIKNVLAELEHLSSRTYNLARAVEKEYDLDKKNNDDLHDALKESFLQINKAGRAAQRLVKSNMLKDAK